MQEIHVWQRQRIRGDKSIPGEQRVGVEKKQRDFLKTQVQIEMIALYKKAKEVQIQTYFKPPPLRQQMVNGAKLKLLFDSGYRAVPEWYKYFPSFCNCPLQITSWLYFFPHFSV